MSSSVPNNYHLWEVLIVIFHSRKRWLTHRQLPNVWGDAPVIETSIQCLVAPFKKQWHQCQRPFVWRKAKPFQRRWIGGISGWKSVSSENKACFGIIIYPPAIVPAIASIGNDFKSKELRFRIIWSQETLRVIYWPVNNYSSGEKGRVFFITSLQLTKKVIYHSNQKRTKSWRLPGHSSMSCTRQNIHGGEVLLCIWDGPEWYHLLDPVDTELNHNSRTISS